MTDRGDRSVATVSGFDADRNRHIVASAFANWSAGTASVFDLLTADAVWTIAGSGPSAGVYRGRQDYIDRAVTPLASRLASGVAPRVKHIWAEGNDVIVRWEQDALAIDGQPYRNSYAWFFHMLDGRIVEATAFLDLNAYDEIIARIKPDRK